jgi:formylglycine-generating enzyme required for sulfatase activity
MARIFLSYRRDDGSGHAGRLFDRLSQHFGRDNLFMDIDAIDPGLDFVEAIKNAVGSCDVLLVVIGRQWLTSTDSEGHRRLDNPEDFVRLEITTALERKIRVIPVLVSGAAMPHPTELPDILQPLARRQALAVGDHFHPDVDLLIATLKTLIATLETAPPSVRKKDRPKVRRHTISDTRVWLVGGVLLCVLVTVLYLVLSGWIPEGPQPASSLTNSLGMQFALIPAGEFQMGSANGFDDERPMHTVRISKLFYLGIHEVTQGQWEAVMGNNPSQFKGDANRPVETVSWEVVQKFIDKLNTREGGTPYRLPTEAEWEYAARAGSTTAYSFGDDISQLGKYAWFADNANNTTHPVGQLQPNAWGLYDMHGNVWEWVQDWYGAYAPEPVTNPQGPASGLYRVFRGGSWCRDAGTCRSACRGHNAPGSRHGLLGFRLLRTAR